MAQGLEAPVTTLLLAVTGLVTYLAFKRHELMQALLFRPRAILVGHQYHRMLTSAFIHGDWVHFVFNAFTLYSFGSHLEQLYGVTELLVIYFASVIGGSLLSLWIHRRDADYAALGASGGVCGVLYASIFLIPGGGIYIMPIPVAIPSWLFAILFLLFSSYGMSSKNTKIGHDAHFGGAIVGVLAAAVQYPQIIQHDPLLFGGVMALSTGVFLWALRRSGG
ncbi:MAG: rhomboid family intramembrane serine protease [Deltaproteobacteria bacterium]|nr:rhomboid family intramembrane serine protease [Deltaproteobacteria bacterium]MBW2418469.1 rhomboid family intramembrane serine protease [Deltaproteobacteria bacterium]